VLSTQSSFSSSGDEAPSQADAIPSSWGGEADAERSPGSRDEVPDSDEVIDLGQEPDDDIITSRRRAPASPKSATRVGYAPWEKVLVVVAAIIGVGFGVWFAGRPAEVASTEVPALSQATADPTVRIAELEATLAGNPNDANAHLELGMLKFDAGEYGVAKEHFLTVTELDPTEVQAWYNLGFVYLSASPSDPVKAQEAWDKVIELDPDSELAEVIETHLSGLLGAATPTPATSAGN
jgi:tetratricopeptide (TPR) repeat protein